MTTELISDEMIDEEFLEWLQDQPHGRLPKGEYNVHFRDGCKIGYRSGAKWASQKYEEKLKELKIKVQMNIYNSAFNGAVKENEELKKKLGIAKEALSTVSISFSVPEYERSIAVLAYKQLGVEK